MERWTSDALERAYVVIVVELAPTSWKRERKPRARMQHGRKVKRRCFSGVFLLFFSWTQGSFFWQVVFIIVLIL